MAATHHAQVFEGDLLAGTAVARAYVADKLHIPVEGNPDVAVTVYERFMLRDAHDLRERASRMPFGAHQAFVCVFGEIMPEAQNALLKLLEEPNAYTSFVFVVPSVSRLLPTVRSRLSYGGRVTGVLTERERAEAFLRASVGERGALLAPLMDKDADRASASAFLDALESVLHEEGVERRAEALREVVFVRTYLTDPSRSLKMLLEHLAVTV